MKRTWVRKTIAIQEGRELQRKLESKKEGMNVKGETTHL